jgi:surfactin synthase thioesterase subunit
MPRTGPRAADLAVCVRRLTPERHGSERRLYCFPFAGGSAASYRPLTTLLPPGVDLVAFQPPGRQDRLGEPAVTDLRSLVPDFAATLLADLDAAADATELRYGLFGHSMGAILAYEVALELARSGAAPPRLLAVSGRRAPHLPPEPGFEPYHRMPDDEFLARVIALGGIPPEVAANPELLELVLPTLKADFAAVETYEGRPEEKLNCSVAVFGGLDDHNSPPERLGPWAALSTARTTVRTYPGGHFFLWDHAPDMFAHISAGLSAAA